MLINRYGRETLGKVQIMRSSPIRPGFRPYPKTPCNGEAAQGTIPVRPPSPGASRMPQTLRVTQSVLLSASFFLFLETGAGGRLNGPPDSCGAVYTKRPCALRILSGKSSGPCCPCAFDVSSRPCHKALCNFKVCTQTGRTPRSRSGSKEFAVRAYRF